MQADEHFYVGHIYRHKSTYLSEDFFFSMYKNEFSDSYYYTQV